MKNKLMRAATILMVLTLMTSCFVGSTFAKYTTSVDSTDTARVARWGFTQTTMDITGLFDKAYKETPINNGTETVLSAVDVIAPGTENSASFTFKYDGGSGSGTNVTAPEVDYTFTVDTTGSECDGSIQGNTNIKWKLDNGTWGTWEALLTSIKGLSGDSADGTMDYEAGNLPAAFPEEDTTHTVYWKWAYAEATDAFAAGVNATNMDTTDTQMGNADALAKVTLKITITATQKD